MNYRKKNIARLLILLTIMFAMTFGHGLAKKYEPIYEYKMENADTYNQYYEAIGGLVRTADSTGRSYSYVDYEGNLKGSTYMINRFYETHSMIFDDDSTKMFVNNDFEVIIRDAELKDMLPEEYKDYHQVHYIGEGIYAVESRGRTAYFNRNKEFLLEPFKYSGIFYFHEGRTFLFEPEENRLYIADTHLKIIGEIDKSIGSFYIDDGVGGYSDGMLLNFNSNLQLYGFIGLDGKMALDYQFDIAEDFNQGYAIVFDRERGYNFIDKSGNIVFDRYALDLKKTPSDFYLWYDGITTVILNEKLQPVYRWGYNIIEEGSCGDYVLAYRAGEHSLYDLGGNLLKQYPFIYYLGDNVFHVNGGILLSSPSGVKHLKADANLTLYQTYDFKCVDNKANLVLDLTQYDAVWSFKEGFARVRKNGLYGFIDNKGNEVVPPEYILAEEMRGGYALLYSKDGIRRALNAKGEVNLVERPGAQEAYYAYEPPASPYTIFEKNGKYGIKENATEQIVLQPTYAEITDFFYIGEHCAGFFQISDDNGKVGFYNANLNIVCKPKYSYLSIYVEYGEILGYYGFNSDFEILNLDGTLAYKGIYRDYEWRHIDDQYRLVRVRGDFGDDSDMFSYLKKLDTLEVIMPLRRGRVKDIDGNYVTNTYKSEIDGRSKLFREVYDFVNKKTTFTDKTMHDQWAMQDGYMLYSNKYTRDYYLVDAYGNPYLEDEKLDNILYPIFDGKFIFSRDTEAGIMDLEGNVLRSGYTILEEYIDGISTVYINFDKGYLDMNLEEVIKVGEYDIVYPFKDGLGLIGNVRE